VAERHGIQHWKRIVNEVRNGIRQWPTFADEFGLTKARIRSVQKAFDGIDAVCKPA